MPKELVIELVFLGESNPEKIEMDLLRVIPKEYYYDVNHLFVWHGRYTCTARKPKCDICAIRDFCKKNNKS